MDFYDLEEPEEEVRGIAVGIDLGTTNSLIAFKRGPNIEIIADPETGSKLLPSIVGYNGSVFIVGSKAKDLDVHVSSIKRLMGKGLSDFSSLENAGHFNFSNTSTDKMLYVKIADVEANPIEISAEILKKLKAIAEDKLQDRVTQAVITVPAYFDDAARNATKIAASIAGIEVLRLINEPTSAAIAYHLNLKSTGTFLVYDLGGGTFDVSILKMQQGILQVIAIAGDSMLGGDDFDYALLRHICQRYEVALPEASLGKALHEVRQIKEALTYAMKWNGYIEFLEQQCIISRAELEESAETLLLKSMKLVKQALRDASLALSDIDEVILVGGVTKMPMIATRLERFLDKKPLTHINPEEVVVIGAAIQAASLTEGGGSLLLDVNPISLGIELLGELVETIISKNAPIPTMVSRNYTTSHNNQTGIKIHIVQGEGQTIVQCRSLGRIELTGLPKRPAGEIDVTVLFRIDADGILTVSATEPTTGKTSEILINPSYGLE